jgi:sugar O-acyltransferase (sialic acid O-acetyltransferase NeuD family)
MNKIKLIGYSGHGLVCAEIAQLSNFEVIGYFDNVEKPINPFQIKYLGVDNDALFNESIFIGIGDNKLRSDLFAKYQIKNKLQFNLIHPKTSISGIIEFGYGNLVCSNVVINTMAKIGNGVIINSGAIIEHECLIANFAHIAPGAVIAGNVVVGERTFIGANATVKQGVRIGKDVTIGAGTVIISDIPDNCTVVGNPGKIIKTKI